MDILLQFVPFLTIVTVIGFSIWWSRRKVAEADAKGIDFQPRGFRGWLLVLAAVVILSLLSWMFSAYEVISRIASDFRQAEALIAAGKIAITLAALSLAALSAYLMVRAKRGFVPVFIAFMVFQVAGGLVLDIISAAAHEIEPWEIGSVTAGHGTIAAMMFAALWIGYVRTSRRVKNTFVR